MTTKLPAGTCTCYVANEVKLHGKSDRPHMFWCDAFDPMREPAPWTRNDLKGPALDRRGIVAHLTGGEPVIDMDPISGGEHAMTERVLKAIAEVHTKPEDASRMGAARPVQGWIIQADAAAKLGLPPDMLIMGDFGNDVAPSTPLQFPSFQVADVAPPTPEEHEQPLPEKNRHEFVYLLVHSDIDQRVKVGISRYGTPLQPFNGRDALRDVYEELIDAVMYVRQLLYERDGK